MSASYTPRRAAHSIFHSVRGLRLHAHHWGDATLATPERPPLLLMHGWMDVAASFQFMVDALAQERWVIAADWRGFGLSEAPRPTDSYSFADYLGDLDGLLDALWPGQPVDLLGHSMGGNVVMLYAGVRPQRVRRLVNLEGFGLPRMPAELAPRRYEQWLDELKQPQALRDYASADEVAQRLCRNNPRLRAEHAAWLAGHWARAEGDRWIVNGDPAHKRTNPVLYRVEEVLACWRRIEAPVLWVDGADTDVGKWWGERFPRAEFDQRLAQVPRVEHRRLADCGHMLHLDQPLALATAIEAFLDAP